MVCLGNICRSPTAEAVLRSRALAAGLDLVVSSAGTGSWHIGQDADRRALATLRAGGYDLDHSARQFEAEWFDTHDLVIAMDRANQRDLLALRPGADVHLLREWDPLARGDLDVPDPYYDDGFESVLAMVERSCDGLLQWLRDREFSTGP